MVYNGTPVVSISGQYQIVDNLEVSADQPGPAAGATRCPSQATGWRVGFQFNGNAQFNTVQNSKASGLTAGIHFEGGTKNKAWYNSLTNNTVMKTNTANVYDDDSGAMGVTLNASGNEVSYNYFSGNRACSEDYGVEGASIEVYQASGNYIHHNTSINETTFSELGGTTSLPSTNNVYAFNLYVAAPDRGELLNLRGYNSSWGANVGTKFYNNTAYRVQLGVACGFGCDASILSIHNNIIWSADHPLKTTIWSDGPIDEGDNIYWRSDGKPEVWINNGPLASNSKIADPIFVNPSANNFNLSTASPAIGKGNANAITSLGITTDLLGVPLRAPFDIGALGH